MGRIREFLNKMNMNENDILNQKLISILFDGKVRITDILNELFIIFDDTARGEQEIGNKDDVVVWRQLSKSMKNASKVAQKLKRG